MTNDWQVVAYHPGAKAKGHHSSQVVAKNYNDYTANAVPTNLRQVTRIFCNSVNIVDI